MTREEYVEKVIEPINHETYVYFSLQNLDAPNYGCLVGDIGYIYHRGLIFGINLKRKKRRNCRSCSRSKSKFQLNMLCF